MILHCCRIYGLFFHVQLAFVKFIKEDLRSSLLVLLRAFNSSHSRREVQILMVCWKLLSYSLTCYPYPICHSSVRWMRLIFRYTPITILLRSSRIPLACASYLTTRSRSLLDLLRNGLNSQVEAAIACLHRKTRRCLSLHSFGVTGSSSWLWRSLHPKITKFRNILFSCFRRQDWTRHTDWCMSILRVVNLTDFQVSSTVKFPSRILCLGGIWSAWRSWCWCEMHLRAQFFLCLK